MARVLRVTGIGFIVVGLLILLFVLYELVGTTQVTKRHQRQLRQEFEVAIADPDPVSLPRGAIARLRIPRIDVDVIVVRGVALDELAKGPGLYPESDPIGSPGVSSIAGHRTGWGAPFFNLNRLRRGDRVTVDTLTGSYTFAVTDNAVVEPEDVWVLQGDPNSSAKVRLTLTTCTPKFTSRDRLIVWADLVEATPRAQRPAQAA